MVEAISVSSVKSYLQNVFFKIDVRNKTELRLEFLNFDFKHNISNLPTIARSMYCYLTHPCFIPVASSTRLPQTNKVQRGFLFL